MFNPQPKREEYGIVLDFLPTGKAGEAHREPVAQLLGEHYFTLLEVALKQGIKASIGERVYIGGGEREKVELVRGRVRFNELTNAAQRELETVVRQVVKSREPEFVNFINRAGAINIRSHTLEHIPGIGKKHLQDILDAREKKTFDSFHDVQQRVPHLGNPEDLIVQRVLEELKGEAKYYLFVKAPAREEEERGFGRQQFSSRRPF